MGDSKDLITRLGAEPNIAIKPTLLLLAPFLASVPYAMPNARILRDVLGLENLDFALAISFAAAATVLSVALIAASKTNRSKERFSTTTTRVASVAYVGLLVMLYATLLFAPDMRLAIGIGACSAFTIAPVIDRWISLYEMDMRNIMFHGALSCAGAAVISWLLSWLPPIGLAIGSIACAIAGCIPAFLPDKRNLADRPANNAGDGLTAENDAPQPARNTLADFLRILWVPFLGMLTCIFISNATEVPMEGYTLHSELIGAFVASIVAVIACFLVRKTPLTMAVEFIVTPSLIALAIVFGSFEPGSMPFYVGASLVFAPLMLMTLFALSLLESVIAARDFSMSFVAGVAVAATTLFTLFGAAVNLAVPSSIIAPHTWVIACIYFAIALVHICFVAWRNITRPATGALSEGSAADKNLDDPKQQAADVEAEWQARVDQLADTHGLTKRERELLGYMSRGYGSTYISKVLFISDNTVRTHIRNIYRKLGVHSREELIALFS